MSSRLVVFIALAGLLAALFARLGVWQLDRLGERRAVNARVAARFDLPVADVADLAGDSSFRRVTIAGVPDHAHEILYTGRSRHGSPGVHILTPIRRADNDTAVLINRGWVYSPDAASADLPRWREDRSRYSGFVMPLGAPPTRQVTGRRVRGLSHDALQALLPYPVARVIVVAEDSAGQEAPVRLDRPALDDGPHLSYAVQWFSFAAIAVVGAGIVAARSRQARRGSGSAMDA
ncbi:MAG: SURF1 family protein [Gemmatimonadaceae bacterium]